MRLSKQRKFILGLIVILTISVPLLFKLAGVTDEQTSTVLTALSSISGLLVGYWVSSSNIKEKSITSKPEANSDQPKP